MSIDGDSLNNGSLELRSVNQLCVKDFKFKVAYYQRGYRWKEAQVRQLLEDLHAFSFTHKAPFYFLQALVVSDHQNGVWNIVDGQQRLTTIALIQEALGVPQRVQISYDRTPSDEQTGTIDSHYQTLTKETIKIWFEGKTDADKTDFKKKLREASFLLYRIPRDDELVVFGRLNSGKISAKDSELVKCVLQTPQLDEPFAVTQARAREWDEIDRALTDDQFFAFFVPRDTWGESDRMAMLFCRAGLCLSIDDARKNNEVFPFLKCVQDGIRKTSRGEVWQRIYSAYYTLAAWHRDLVMYHAAGWYMHRKGGTSIWSMTINDIRSQLSKALTVARTFMSEQTTQIPDGDREDYYNRHHEPENYLFLLNVAFCWRRRSMRYDFTRHRQIEFWSLEHIVARNERDYNKEAFLRLCPQLLTEADWQEYQKKCEKNERDQWLNKKLGDDRWPIKDDHNIRNLALLGKAENSSLNDNLFEGKRPLVLDWSTGKNGDGYWVPPATQAVFFKTIPGTDPWTSYWSEKDKREYVKYMREEVQAFVTAAREVCRAPEGVK